MVVVVCERGQCNLYSFVVIVVACELAGQEGYKRANDGQSCPKKYLDGLRFLAWG